MKSIIAMVNTWTQEEISKLEAEAIWKGEINGDSIELNLEDFVITTDDIPGWLVANESKITVALDIKINDNLRSEGIAREFVNKIQNLRKDSGLEVTDRIELFIKSDEKINDSINKNLDYICSETLADKLNIVDQVPEDQKLVFDVEEGVSSELALSKV